MALVLGRRDGESVIAETKDGIEVVVTLLSHRYNGRDKVAIIRVDYENGDQVEHDLSKNEANVAEICSSPYVGVSLMDAQRNQTRLAFHGTKEDVTFLRREVKERKNG
ncbi:hypothetical protein ACRXCV_00355 (plasmid) [Halobacteriovorax sp. GFR7]|uniref:hypothetical protein n=1 Tax=unclassified Halobacteriovorax TaxID=2639665 RepID=UPI003D99808C